MSNPHYDPGDLITYYELPVLPATTTTAVYVGMVVREFTSAEVADLEAYYSGIEAPVFWVRQLGYGNGSSLGPEMRTAGQPYGYIDAVNGSSVITVIKASGDSDTIAGLLT